MKKHRAMHEQLGYALVDALVSLLVVAAGILGVAKLQAVVVGSSAEAKARAEAMTLAQAKLDELRNVVLQSQHHQWVGGACQPGTLVQTGSDTVGGVNANFTRTWTITPTCAPARHQIVVSVGWTGADNGARQVQLHSVIAWNDPARSTAKLAAGTTGGGGMAPQGNAWLGDDVKDYDTLPEGAVSNGADGTHRFYNAEEERWELLVAAAGGGYRAALYSSVPIVSLSGIVALDTASGTATDVLINNVVVYRSDITYCLFPLKFTNQDDPKTYGSDGAGGTGQTSASADKAGAYVCYVPQGWYGDIGLFQRSYNCANNYNLFDGEDKLPGVPGCKFHEAQGCPGIVDGSATLTGIRTHKVLIVDASNQIVGQSGVMPGHEYMLSPDSSTRTRLSRLDFFIFKPQKKGDTCADRIPNTSTTISGTISTGAAYSIQLRNGAGTTTTGTDGVPSIRYPHYIVDRYLSGGGGFVKLSGAVSGACTTLQATGSSGWANFICRVSSGQYSCEVSYGWSGTVGGQSFSNVTADTERDVNCPP